MHKNILVYLCLALAIALSLAGCGTQQDAASTPALEPPLLTVTSGGDTIIPQQSLAYSTTWHDSERWIIADGVWVSMLLPDIAQSLPSIIYGEDFAVHTADGVSISQLSVFDESFERLYHNEELSILSRLPAGNYYISHVASRNGDYIESEGEYERLADYCIYKLIVE